MPGASLIPVVMTGGKGSRSAPSPERHRDGCFDAQRCKAEVIAALLGPVVGLQLRANRLLAGRMADCVDVAALVGPRRPGLKLARWRQSLWPCFWPLQPASIG